MKTKAQISNKFCIFVGCFFKLSQSHNRVVLFYAHRSFISSRFEKTGTNRFEKDGTH